jgi:glycosyltransferase involved in cell wall biosynthesis
VVALDRFLESFPLDRLDFMNLDVEASEREVLQGARRTIRRFKPKIVIEVHEGVSVEDLEREISMSDGDYAFTREDGFLVAEREAGALGLPPILPAAATPVTNLYLTHDVIGTPSGGGVVTLNEYRAFASLSVNGATCPMDGLRLKNHADPTEADRMVLQQLQNLEGTGRIGRVHLYAGCFSETVRWLRERGSIVTYTAAAHDIKESRREFEELGIPYDFPHLTEPELWKRYVAGYLAADMVVCPSTLSRRIMESYGAKRVVVIPHGCDIPREPAPLPARFVAGFLGQGGPDKGLRYLFQAWKQLALKDGLLLVAGNNIGQALPLWHRFGGGNVEFMGFVKDIGDFFSRISVYCQPSVSEGFGIEVLEAAAHARPVVVSTGAGAADVVTEGVGFKVPPRDAGAIAEALDLYRSKPELAVLHGSCGRGNAAAYDWKRIRAQYVSIWKSLDGEAGP